MAIITGDTPDGRGEWVGAWTY